MRNMKDKKPSKKQKIMKFLADDSSLGLEMYGWAHGVLSDEWIIIH